MQELQILWEKNVYKKVNIFRDNECLYCLNLRNIR